MIFDRDNVRIIVNPLKNKKENLFGNRAWVAAARPGKIPKDQLPKQENDPYVITQNVPEWKINLNRWALEGASLVFGVTTIGSLATIPSMLTVDTIGPNFELHTAPDLTAAMAAGCIGLASAGACIFTHKGASAWKEIQEWMNSQQIDTVDVASKPSRIYS